MQQWRLPRLPAALSAPLRGYRRASRRAPLAVAFGTCFLKGSASDAVAQKVVEERETLDVRRNLALCAPKQPALLSWACA